MGTISVTHMEKVVENCVGSAGSVHYAPSFSVKKLNITIIQISQSTN